MIKITNNSKRLRSYRVPGSHPVWIEPGVTVSVDVDMPPKARLRAFASSGLRIRPDDGATETGQEGVSRLSGEDGSGEGREGGQARPPGAPDPVQIPVDWRNMPATLLKEIAGALAGNPVRSRAHAVTIIAEEVAKRGGDPAA